MHAAFSYVLSFPVLRRTFLCHFRTESSFFEKISHALNFPNYTTPQFECHQIHSLKNGCFSKSSTYGRCLLSRFRHFFRKSMHSSSASGGIGGISVGFTIMYCIAFPTFVDHSSDFAWRFQGWSPVNISMHIQPEDQTSERRPIIPWY